MNSTEWADATEAPTTLWKTVDNSGDDRAKTGDGFPPHAPPFQDQKLMFLCELVDALISGFDLLAARVDQLEREFDEHVEQSFDQLNLFNSNQPLSQQALLEKLRALRDQIAI